MPVIRAFRTVMGLARTIFDIAGLRRLATFCAWGTSPFYCFREEKDVVTEVVVSHLQVFDLSRPPPTVPARTFGSDAGSCTMTRGWRVSRVERGSARGF
jgi:hypothetical protein